jgi:hypothetical protein
MRAFDELQKDGLADRETGHGEKGTAYGYGLTPRGIEVRDSLSVHLSTYPEQLDSVSAQPNDNADTANRLSDSSSTDTPTVQPPPLNEQLDQ